eukprot:scaffold1954_cov268-Pinguiococcus_pyrenoidosus.AAC.36
MGKRSRKRPREITDMSRHLAAHCFCGLRLALPGAAAAPLFWWNHGRAKRTPGLGTQGRAARSPCRLGHDRLARDLTRSLPLPLWPRSLASLPAAAFGRKQGWVGSQGAHQRRDALRGRVAAYGLFAPKQRGDLRLRIQRSPKECLRSLRREIPACSVLIPIPLKPLHQLLQVLLAVPLSPTRLSGKVRRRQLRVLRIPTLDPRNGPRQLLESRAGLPGRRGLCHRAERFSLPQETPQSHSIAYLPPLDAVSLAAPMLQDLKPIRVLQADRLGALRSAMRAPRICLLVTWGRGRRPLRLVQLRLQQQQLELEKLLGLLQKPSKETRQRQEEHIAIGVEKAAILGKGKELPRGDAAVAIDVQRSDDALSVRQADAHVELVHGAAELLGVHLARLVRVDDEGRVHARVVQLGMLPKHVVPQHAARRGRRVIRPAATPLLLQEAPPFQHRRVFRDADPSQGLRQHPPPHRRQQAQPEEQQHRQESKAGAMAEAGA